MVVQSPTPYPLGKKPDHLTRTTVAPTKPTPKYTQRIPAFTPSNQPETLSFRLLHSMHLVVAGLFLLVAGVCVLDTQSRPNHLRTYSQHQLVEYAMDMRMMAFVSERLRMIELQRSAALATSH
tara:strand:- start:35 stop:403 length:369 start_codon:yes stop_codon:yes gene_type:complete